MEPLSFSDVFWNLLREEFHIYSVKEKKSSKTVKNIFEDDEEDLLIDVQAILKWSTNNKELYKQLKKKHYVPEICNQEYLHELYTNLKLERKNIAQLSEELLKFKNLKQLRLNCNQILVVDYLPPSIEELYLNYNQIIELKFQAKLQNLVYLGLGFNKIADNSFEDFSKFTPGLRCLDLAFNNLCSLENTILSLANLKQLRILSLKGNPFSLYQYYKKTIINELLLIKFLDDEEMLQENPYSATLQMTKGGSISANIINQKQANSTSPIKQQQGLNAVQQMQFKDDFDLEQQNTEISELEIKDNTLINIELSVSVLENVVGFLLNKEKFPNFDQDPISYQSTYWLQAKIGRIDINTKQNRVLYSEATIENEKARIDFKFNLKETFKPTPEYRDIFYEGLVIKIMRSQPIEESKDANGEPVYKMQNDKPYIEEEVYRVFRIDTCEWLMKPSKEKSIQVKYNVFKQNVIEYFEYCNPCGGEDEKIEKYLENQNESNEKEKAQEIKNEKPIEKNTKPVPKPNVKDTKKTNDKKTAKKPGKDDPPPKQDIPIPDLPIYKRNKIFVEETQEVIFGEEEFISVNISLQ